MLSYRIFVLLQAYYKMLMEEKYGEGPKPYIYQELWETISIVKKNYIKVIGQCPRASTTSSYSSSSQSTQSTSADPIDLIMRICEDRFLLVRCVMHLREFTAEDLVTAMAELARQQEQQKEKHEWVMSNFEDL